MRSRRSSRRRAGGRRRCWPRTLISTGGRQARHGEVRQLVQRGRAARVRARHGAAALVRVRAGDGRLQDGGREGPVLRRLRCGRPALAQWGNPFSAALRPAPQLEAGRADARARGGRRREDAARARLHQPRRRLLYDKFETVDQRTRLRAYRDAMGRLAATVPGRSGSRRPSTRSPSRRPPIRRTRPTSIN